MSGWPMKDQARVVGIDDGRYIRDSVKTPLVLTLMRLDGYIDGIHMTMIDTDGSDSAETITEALISSGFSPQTRAILSDGACLAGFNVLDMELLNDRSGIPVITCSDSEPDTASVRSALKENFQDWKRRFDLIDRFKPVTVNLPDGPCYIRCCGITPEKASWVVRRCNLRGRMPEPLRISHMIASSLPEAGM